MQNYKHVKFGNPTSKLPSSYYLKAKFIKVALAQGHPYVILFFPLQRTIIMYNLEVLA